MSTEYTSDEETLLLNLARKTIEASLRRESLPGIDTLPPRLLETRSCFVTLQTRDGELRGCIGNIGAFEALARNVRSNARNAAFTDPRFPKVSSLDELASLTIEISILTQPRPVRSSEEFEVGRHGIILKKAGRSAVFLPQVAPEQGWDRETTLDHLTMKAGLPIGSWREPDTEFEVFEAVVFSEPKRS